MLKTSQARWAGFLWLFSSALYLLCEAVSASAFPGYSYALNYVSDLGMSDVGLFDGRMINSPLHAVMNFGLVARGILFALAGLLMARAVMIGSRSVFVILALLHGAGGALVGLVPAGPSSAAAGIAFLHVLGALLAILPGNAILIYVGQRSTPLSAPGLYRIGCTAAGILGFAGFALLLANMSLHRPVLFGDGVWERLSIYPIVAWTTVTGILILAVARRR